MRDYLALPQVPWWAEHEGPSHTRTEGEATDFCEPVSKKDHQSASEPSEENRPMDEDKKVEASLHTLTRR